MDSGYRARTHRASEEGGVSPTPGQRRNFSTGGSQTIPERNLKLNHTLDAAFACFWADILGQPDLLHPYTSTGFLEPARKLIALSDSMMDDPASDCGLVNPWAKELGMMSWYRWVPVA